MRCMCEVCRGWLALCMFPKVYTHHGYKASPAAEAAKKKRNEKHERQIKTYWKQHEYTLMLHGIRKPVW